MRYYAITRTEAPHASESRLATYSMDFARIKALQEEGRLLIAGSFPAIDSDDPGPAGFSGSLIVATFSSLDAAKTWAEADPYFATSVYIKVEVKPFILATP